MGTVAIQLAKHLGAQVATTVSGKNADLVRELGADVVIDYQTQDFEAELSEYDFVLDPLGGAPITFVKPREWFDDEFWAGRGCQCGAWRRARRNVFVRAR